MKCPRCGADACQIVTETSSHYKGYGAGKGCLGYLCFGPLGLLCGMCGMGEGRTHSKTYWICHNCGNKFQA